MGPSLLEGSVNIYFVSGLVSGVKGAPCLVNMFKYPNFKDNQRPVASKSFYKVSWGENFLEIALYNSVLIFSCL